MKQNKDLDQILQHALSPEEEPDYWLNQNILRKAKEIGKMDRKQKRRIPAAVMTAALALSVGSVTAFAAWNYLTPDKVAKVMEDKGLMQAFKSKDAISINESQTYGDLKITLLGIVSGKNLSRYMNEDTAAKEISGDKTYVVTAVEKADGTSIDASDDEYSVGAVTVSPLVKGLKPWQFNIYTMGDSGCTAMTEDGIEYRITECDNVEMFADRGLYISVSDGVPSADAYQYDEKTGEITRNESYKGVNALFNLPIDKSKADPEAAKEYLKEMEKMMEGEDTNKGLNSSGITVEGAEVTSETDENKLVDKVSKWDNKELEKHADLLEDSTKVLTPDKDGVVTTPAYKFRNDGGECGEGMFSVKEFFEGKKVGEPVISGILPANDVVYVETFTLNEDGTVTMKVYHYSEKK